MGKMVCSSQGTVLLIAALLFPCGYCQVKLAYQESEIAALLKKIPLGTNEMNTIRGRAEELREGTLCDYRPVLPLMLASFIFDVLCTPGNDCIGLSVCRAYSEMQVLRDFQTDFCIRVTKVLLFMCCRLHLPLYCFKHILFPSGTVSPFAYL